MVGVSELQGAGDCPKRPGTLGHIWQSWKVNSRKPCEFCGTPGRDNRPIGQEPDTGGFFARATAARTEMIGNLNARRELTQEQKDRAAVIVEDKRRRDREAVEAGVGRPGQAAGVKR